MEHEGVYSRVEKTVPYSEKNPRRDEPEGVGGEPQPYHTEREQKKRRDGGPLLAVFIGYPPS